MITSLGTSTLAANPRHSKRHKATGRFKRSPGKSKAARTAARSANRKAARQKVSAKKATGRIARVYSRSATTKKGASRFPFTVQANPGKKFRHGKRRNPLIGSIYKGKRGNLKIVKNPGGLVIAGVPVIPAVIGSLSAIAICNIAAALQIKYATSIPAAVLPYAKYIPPVALLGAAFAINKYVKNPMAKEAAKYAGVAAIFLLAQGIAGDPIKEAVTKAMGGMSGHAGGNVGGFYFDPYGVQHDDVTAGVGGLFQSVNGFTDNMAGPSGLDFFQGQSMYG